MNAIVAPDCTYFTIFAGVRLAREAVAQAALESHGSLFIIAMIRGTVPADFETAMTA